MLTRALGRVVINSAFGGPGQEQLNITAMLAQMKGQSCIPPQPLAVAGRNGGGAGLPQVQEATVVEGRAPAAIVFDCLPDLRGARNHALIAPRLKADIAYLRVNGHSSTPIVLAEGTDYTNAWAIPGVAAETATRRAILRRTFDELVAAGDKHLHYVNGSQLWGVDPAEVARAGPTVVGTHPSDLGEERLAHFWYGYFQALLPARQPLKLDDSPGDGGSN
jgi:hypothetical protein